MPLAGHGKVCPGLLFHPRRKKTDLIDNEIHVTAENIFISKHCAILARTVISTEAFCDSGKEHSAIL